MAGPSAPEAGRVSVRVLPKTSDFRPALRKFLEKLAARELLTIRTEADTDGLARDVRRAVDYAQKSAPALDVGTDVDAGDLVRETRQAAAIAEKSAKISLPVDLSKLGALVGSLGGLLKGGVALAGIVSAVGTLASLGRALAPAVGALGAIPAIAVAAGGALATLKIGLSGVGDALGGDADALAKLAPSARAFVGTVAELRPAFEELRQSVQANLFAGLAASLRDVADTWLPRLSTQLPGIASGFNAIAKGIAEGAQSPALLAGVDSALGSTGTALSGLAAGVAPLMDAVGRIIGAFGPSLAGAGDAAANLAEKFSAFIKSADESGALSDFVSTVGATLNTLGGVLANVGSILHSVSSAATSDGAGMLGVINQVTASVAEFFKSAEGQSALSTLFESAHTVISSLLPVVTTLASGIGSVLAPALADVARAAGPALEVLGGALVDGVAALAPHIGPLAEALAGIVTAAAPLLPVVGQLAGVLAGVLAGALSNVGLVLGPLVEALTGAFSPELISSLAASFGAWMTAMQPLAERYGPLLAGAVTQLLGPLLQLVPTLVDALLPALLAWSGAQLDLLAAVLPILPPVVKLVAALAPVIALAARLASVIIQLAVRGLQPLIDLLVILVGWIADGLVWWIGTAMGALSDWGRRFVSFGRDLGQIAQKIIGWWSNVNRFFGGLPGHVLGALASLPGRLWSLGRDMIRGVLSGLRSMGSAIADLLWGMASDAWQGVKSFFGISSPSKLFAWLGEMVGAGWVDGLESVRAPVVRTSTSLATAAYEPWRPRPGDITPAPSATDAAPGAIGVSVRLGDQELHDLVVDAVRSRPEDIAATVRHGNRLATVRG